MDDITPENARLELGELLQDMGATMTVQRLLARPDGGTEWNRRALHWQCLITAPKTGTLQPVTWSCGEGWALIKPWPGASFVVRAAFRKLKASRPGTLSHADAAKAILEAYPGPALVDVVSSLLMDTSDADQAFERWAADLGYDTDSRKAFAAWEACNVTRREMLRLFGPAFDRACELAGAM